MRRLLRKRKQKSAAALKYDVQKDAAPRITASGRGFIAEKILQLAKEHNIPVHEDPELAEILTGLPVGSAIPSELYRAVAEILAWVYQMNKKYRQ